MFLPAPLNILQNAAKSAPDTGDDAASQTIYLLTAAVLVALGGAFAGLTIALMGQDEVYLQVLAASGDNTERKHATKVLNLLKRGKHWVLVTLLLGNVITNETLPIMLDRSLGGGWQAVLGSTVLIVIFGEIVPQSVCVRYGLPIGAFMTPFVVLLMWVLAPVAWPTAKLLDHLLGQDHGTTYKKAGLKTLVTLHRTLGTSPEERLNRDEVTIISAVLDLKEKPVGSIMTPMEDVFTLSADTILDTDMMNTILSEGYSRIPIYAVDDPENFIGMLLVKMLITYDPEDCLRVDDFQLATLPETRAETSCLDIVNFFQEGKSHMVLISEFPGEPHGALGVLTLEDVIEELIGEEIIDESDVFIDVHKAIRRIQPVSYFKVPKEDTDKRNEPDMKSSSSIRRVSDVATRTKTPKLRRRKSSGGTETLSMLRDDENIRAHLKHLGPSNVASRPKSTKINTVKIKPGHSSTLVVPMRRSLTQDPKPSTQLTSKSPSRERPASTDLSNTQNPLELDPEAAETTALLTAGYPAKDGVQAVGYGSLQPSPTQKTANLQPPLSPAAKSPGPTSPLIRVENVPASPEVHPQSQNLSSIAERSSESPENDNPPQDDNLIDLNSSTDGLPPHTKPSIAAHTAPHPLHASTLASTDISSTSPPQPRRASTMPEKLVVAPVHSWSDGSDDEANPDEESSGQTIKSTLSVKAVASSMSSGTLAEIKSNAARSGSIFEREAEVGGVKKVILDIKEGADHTEDEAASGDELLSSQDKAQTSTSGLESSHGGEPSAAKKKKKKKKSGKKKGKGHSDEGSQSGGISLM